MVKKVDKSIQGLFGPDVEGCNYARLLAKVILSQEKRKTKWRIVLNEKQSY